jgi:hypothetical protein
MADAAGTLDARLTMAVLRSGLVGFPQSSVEEAAA